MKKLKLKFTAKSVASIEEEMGLPIAQCAIDNKISNMVLFIQKGYVKENDKLGIDYENAMNIIDEYLKNSDTDELLFDIIESLVDGGFISRKLDIKKLRKAKSNEMESVMKSL